MQEYRHFAIDLAKQAGMIMRRNFGLGMAKEWKGDRTPLTATDTAINQLVIDAVKKTYRDHGVLAEEGSARTGTEEYTWVCDPLDGTIPFSHGLPIFTFSLALTRNGESILGVIFDPILDRLCVAEKGHGTQLNNEPVRVAAAPSLENGLVELTPWLQAQFNLFPLAERLDRAGAQTMNSRSFAYHAILIASGAYLAGVYAGSNPWDGAAPKIVVEEAGGRVTDLFGNDQRYDRPIRGALASNGQVHDALLAVIRPALEP